MNHNDEKARKSWAGLVNALQIGVIITGNQGVIHYINVRAAEIFQRDGLELIGSPFGFPLGKNEDTEIEIIHPDDTVTIAEIHVHEGFWIDKKSWIITLQDITERKQKEAELEIAARVFSSSRESIIITDMDGRMIDVNKGFEQTFGYKKEEAIGKNVNLIKSGKQRPEFYQHMFSCLKKKGSWQGELWDKRKDGKLVPVVLTISSIKNINNETVFYVGLLHDISLIKEHKQQLLYLAHFDPLTTLYNLNYITTELEKCIKHYKITGTPFSLAYVDIDRFQDINKQFDNQVGDKVLIKFSQTIRRFIGEQGLVARISGNTFAILVNQNKIEKSPRNFFEKLRKTITKKIRINKRDITFSCSIGYVIYPLEDSASSGQVLRQAESAMIESKIKGGNQTSEYNIDEIMEQKHRHHIINEVIHGINANEFVVFYQPKVNMRTGYISGAEALIRWQHPKKGLCSPGYFLPYLEGNEIMIRLSSFIFDEVFKQLDEWLNQGIDLIISINVSAHELQHENFFHDIKKKLEQYDNRLNEHIELELLETAAVRDIKAVSEIINNFHDINLRVSLDDFGTGYSSLSYLRAMQVDAIKIDQSFINEMFNSPKVIAILDSILHMARRFNQGVIAEGVDSLEKGILLLQLGCIEGQGYFIGKPMPASEFLSWMDSWSAPSEWRQQHSVYQEHLVLIYAKSFINWAVNRLSKGKIISVREMVNLELSLNNLDHYVRASIAPEPKDAQAELLQLINQFSHECKQLNTNGTAQKNKEIDLANLNNISQLLQKRLDLLRLKIT